MNYNKYIILDIQDDWDDDKISLLAFLVKMAIQDRRYTGYKEIQNAGIDLDYFLENTHTRLNRSGAIKIDMELVRHFTTTSIRSVTRYYLDTDIFKYEYDVFGAFKRRDPVWFIPYDEFNQYDEEMFSKLPEILQNWFVKKIKKGITTPAQKLLEFTYNKYVVRGEPFKSLYATTSKTEQINNKKSN